jgi:hypothetical protein
MQFFQQFSENKGLKELPSANQGNTTFSHHHSLCLTVRENAANYIN